MTDNEEEPENEFLLEFDSDGTLHIMKPRPSITFPFDTEEELLTWILQLQEIKEGLIIGRRVCFENVNSPDFLYALNTQLNGAALEKPGEGQT